MRFVESFIGNWEQADVKALMGCCRCQSLVNLVVSECQLQEDGNIGIYGGYKTTEWPIGRTEASCMEVTTE